MKTIFKLESIKKELIWGSESWLISGHENGYSYVIDGNKKINLNDFYLQNKHLFNNNNDTQFPLLVKIIDAKDDLSIQVHPDDLYASKKHNSLGKTECWLVLETQLNNQIIVGQISKNKEELKKAIDDKKIMQCLKFHDVKKDDFFFIKAGTIHAIKGGTKILEVQQSSDITYRLYDYDRADSDGNLRDLHIEDSLNVVDYDADFEKVKRNTMKTEALVKSKFFNVESLIINKDYSFENKYNFIIGYVLDCEVKINGQLFTRGDAFIIPAKINLNAKGSGQVMISYIN